MERRIRGSDNDRIDAMALDSSGAVYVTGSSSSQDFPLTAGDCEVQGHRSAARHSSPLKLNPNSILVYSSILGRALGDSDPAAIAVNSAASFGWDVTARLPNNHRGIPNDTRSGHRPRVLGSAECRRHATPAFDVSGGRNAFCVDSGRRGQCVRRWQYQRLYRFSDYAGSGSALDKGGSRCFCCQVELYRRWTHFLTMLGNGATLVAAIAIDSEQNLYVTGAGSTGFFTKLNPNATQILYNTNLETRGLAVMVGPDRSAWIARDSGRTYGFPELNYTPTVGVGGVELMHSTGTAPRFLLRPSFP